MIQSQAKIYQIPSRSNPDAKYRVVLDIKGQWHCQCFPYLKTGICWHILRVKENPTKYELPA